MQAHEKRRMGEGRGEVSGALVRCPLSDLFSVVVSSGL